MLRKFGHTAFAISLPLRQHNGSLTRDTALRWTPNSPTLVFLADRGYLLAPSTWGHNLPHAGERSATLGFHWETNVDIKRL